MIYFYTEKLTPRVQYVCTHVFSNMLGKKIEWVNALEALPDAKQHVVVAYTSEACPKGVYQIYPNGLLFKKGIKKQAIEMSEWNGLKTFFTVQGGNMPFDIFSAIFYLISRYEEWVATPEELDSFGRFKAQSSLAYQQGFLQEPLVDKWVAMFEGELKSHFACYTENNQRRFLFRPIIAIDRLFKYQNRSFVYNTHQFFRNLVKGRWNAIKTQAKSIFRISEDPFCNFSSLLQLHNRNNLTPIFFLRVAYDSWLERPIYATQMTYRKLLMHNYLFELHSGQNAAINVSKLMSERKKLYKITKSQVTMNCFYRLRFKTSVSYRNLLKASFKDDYSMAYLSMIGFRASTCTPYRYYDLEKEDYYKLTIHPIAFCDDVLRSLKYTREEIYAAMMQMANEVRQVKGEFVCIYHNDVLSDSGRWHRWYSLYESAIRAIASMEVKS